MTSNEAFPITPDYPRLTFHCCSSFSFPSLTTVCTSLSYVLRSRDTHFLQNHVLLFTLREHYFIDLLWICRLNTKIFFPRRMFVARAIRRGNLVKVLGQQPRYQRVPSSVTMWQLFHRDPAVSSRHHKLLTRQLLPTYMP